MSTFLWFMPGHGLTEAEGVIFVDARVGWWIDFPVESERVMDPGHLREAKEIEIAQLPSALRCGLHLDRTSGRPPDSRHDRGPRGAASDELSRRIQDQGREAADRAIEQQP